MAARPTTRVKVQARSRTRVGTIPKFPAQVIAGDGIEIEESGGVFTFSLDADYAGVWGINGDDIYSNNAGSVGIGTSTPDAGAKLHVTGGILTSGVFLSNLASSGGIDYFSTGLRLFSVGASGSTQGTFQFVSVGADGSAASRLVIS